VQDECHCDVLGAVIGVEQEIRVKVDLAVVLDIEAGARLQVGEAVGIRQCETKICADPVAHLRGRRDEVHPDRLDVGEVRPPGYLHLPEPAVVQLECVQRDLLALVLRGIQQFLAHLVGQQQQDAVEAIYLDLLPGEQPILLGERLEDACSVDRVQIVEQLAELAEVLAVHERLDQLVVGHFLAIDQVFDQPVPRQQTLRLVEVLGQSVEIRIGMWLHGSWSPGLDCWPRA
jgi:hypothetical protein